MLQSNCLLDHHPHHLYNVSIGIVKNRQSDKPGYFMERLARYVEVRKVYICMFICKCIEVPLLTLSISYRHCPMTSHWKIRLQDISDTLCYACDCLKAKCHSQKNIQHIASKESWSLFIFSVKHKVRVHQKDV